MRHGFLFINKPVGPTSHDIVAMARKALHEKKVGHLGTLDPAASGLLVLAVGAKALKVVELYNSLPKQYTADITLGSISATYDREGPIEEFARKPGVSDPSEHEVLEAIRDRFIGKIDQVPPTASAVKVSGERAYKAMREGRGVDMPTRTVEISACDIVSYAYPKLKLHVACGSGTYIRSLAHDLGQALRIGGYLSALERTHVGKWNLDDAVSPDEIKWSEVTPLKEVLVGRPSIELTDEQFTTLSHGQTIEGDCEEYLIGWNAGLPVAILEQKAEGEMKVRKVL